MQSIHELLVAILNNNELVVSTGTQKRWKHRTCPSGHPETPLSNDSVKGGSTNTEIKMVPPVASQRLVVKGNRLFPLKESKESTHNVGVKRLEKMEVELEEAITHDRNADWSRGMDTRDQDGIIDEEIIYAGKENMNVEDSERWKAVETQCTKEQVAWVRYRKALRRRLKSDGKDINWYVWNKSARLWSILREFGINERLLTNKSLVRYLTA